MGAARTEAVPPPRRGLATTPQLPSATAAFSAHAHGTSSQALSQGSSQGPSTPQILTPCAMTPHATTQLPTPCAVTPCITTPCATTPTGDRPPPLAPTGIAYAADTGLPSYARHGAPSPRLGGGTRQTECALSPVAGSVAGSAAASVTSASNVSADASATASAAASATASAAASVAASPLRLRRW